MNANPQLFPRPPRRMRQPTKATLREHLAAAADEIERQRVEIERLSRPWWKRLRQRAGGK